MSATLGSPSSPSLAKMGRDNRLASNQLTLAPHAAAGGAAGARCRLSLLVMGETGATPAARARVGAAARGAAHRLQVVVS